MKIFNHLKSDWFRYGFETLAIIVGILIAFALENWGHNQQVKKEEQVVKELNFIRMINTSMPEIKTDHEPPNNYALLLEDPRVRNLLAIKLALTKDVMDYRLELDAEILSLISLLATEIDTFN